MPSLSGDSWLNCKSETASKLEDHAQEAGLTSDFLLGLPSELESIIIISVSLLLVFDNMLNYNSWTTREVCERRSYIWGNCFACDILLKGFVCRFDSNLLELLLSFFLELHRYCSFQESVVLLASSVASFASRVRKWIIDKWAMKCWVIDDEMPEMKSEINRKQDEQQQNMKVLKQWLQYDVCSVWCVIGSDVIVSKIQTKNINNRDETCIRDYYSIELLDMSCRLIWWSSRCNNLCSGRVTAVNCITSCSS